MWHDDCLQYILLGPRKKLTHACSSLHVPVTCHALKILEANHNMESIRHPLVSTIEMHCDLATG